jgi:NitT/TauT family transport system substrate-binding protein
MNSFFSRFALCAMALAMAVLPAAAQDKIKVGYWTSGFSVGFGAVLEAGKFLEAQGLQPEFIKFSDVNGPTKALLTHSIDVAFAAPSAGAFTIGAQGAPVNVILATQIAEATFVAKQGSALTKLTDLKGRKVGMSPAGSAAYAISTAILEKTAGLKPSDFTAVPGNEGQLLRLLQQGDIDAAALRAVTIASAPDFKFQSLGGLVDGWKAMLNTTSVPILGVSIIHRDYLTGHREAAVKYVRAVIAATTFGRAEPAKASDILSHTANLDAQDATSYVKLWDQIYMARLEPDDIATLKATAEIFKAAGTLEGTVPDALYNPQPYEEAKRAR